MTLKLSILGVAVAAALTLGAAGNAAAHATSIGYSNAGAGAVTVWLGTYQHGGHHLEGSMNLVGVLGTVYASTTNPFTLLVGAGTPAGGGKPAGLVDGVTNFFAPNGTVGSSAPLVGVDPNLFGGVNHWQGATFSGLSAGDYQFTWTPIPGASAEWSLLNTNMDGIFNLRGVVNPTPEPGSLALVGLAIFGLAAVQRRRAA